MTDITQESSQTQQVQVMNAMPLQTVDNITAIRPVFLEDSRNTELIEQANNIVDLVIANPTDASIAVQVFQLGSEYMNQNTESVGLMDTKIGTVMQEIQTGSPVNKSLTQIKTNLDLINPAVVGKTEQTFTKKYVFGLIAWASSRLPKGDEILNVINERKDSIKTTIDGLKRHLHVEKDKALHNATELGHISNKLFDTQVGLQEAVYQGQLIWDSLSNHLTNATDPVRSQAIRSLVNDLAVQVVDIQTVDTLNVQSRLSAETLIANARKIQQGVNRVNNVLLPAVATNLMVKAAAAQQASLVGAMSDITRSAEQTILDTQKQTRDVAVKMEQMQSDGLVNPAVLEEAANEVVKMIDEIEQIRLETESKARATSKALNDVSSKMRKYADPMTNARHALENAEV